MKYCRVGRFSNYTPIFLREELLMSKLRDTSLVDIALHIETSTAESFMSFEQRWFHVSFFKMWRR